MRRVCRSARKMKFRLRHRYSVKDPVSLMAWHKLSGTKTNQLLQCPKQMYNGFQQLARNYNARSVQIIAEFQHITNDKGRNYAENSFATSVSHKIITNLQDGLIHNHNLLVSLAHTRRLAQKHYCRYSQV